MPTTIKTADYNVQNKQYMDTVYEPAEDSFALIDAIEKDLDCIQNKGQCVVLEVGCGSGIVIRSLASTLPNNLYMGFDISYSAMKCTLDQQQVSSDSFSIELCQMNLTNNIITCPGGIFDVIIFNPPYVPTPHEDIFTDGISRTWAGGIHGTEIIMKFIIDLPRVLSKPDGLCYLLLIAPNDIEFLRDYIKKLGLKSHSIIQRSAGNERISVLKITWIV